MSQRPKRVRVNVENDKSSIKSRGDRASLTTSVAPKSPIYKAHDEVQASCTALGTAGVALLAADEAVRQAETALSTARGLRATGVSNFDR